MAQLDKRPNTGTQRRFIAGALCPECGAEDRLVVESSGVGESQHCVSCGFRSSHPPATKKSSESEYLSADESDVQMVHIQPAAQPKEKV